MDYSDGLLDALRREADPLADQVVTDILDRREAGTINEVLRHFIHNRQPLPADLPPEVGAYLERTRALPDFADEALLERASSLFQRHGVAVSLILVTDSLIECYAARTGVKVLSFSYRLGHNAYRRVAETAQFMFDVLAPGGLEEGGDGRVAVQKVRLMHAAIRHLVRETGRWDEAAWGVPICQEDMLGTVQSFSLIVIKDLPKLGIHLGRDETEAWFHFWRVIGDMLGCRRDLNPATIPDGQALLDAIRRRHHGPSEEGIAMTRALVEMHDIVIPGHLERGFAAAITRHLAGDQIADWLEVPRSHLDRLPAHESTIGFFLELSNRFGRALLERESFDLAGYQRAAFDIPTSLAEAWQLGGAAGGARADA